jgi:hypothetical protein
MTTAFFIFGTFAKTLAYMPKSLEAVAFFPPKTAKVHAD